MRLNRLILATNNQHKIAEMSELLRDLEIELFCKGDFEDFPDVPETGATLKDNSLLKARAVYEKYRIPSIADDTGLLVDYLDGAPGVRSARYAGEQCSFLDNNRKLLTELKGVPEAERRAVFVTVIALVDGEEEHCFEGVVEGRILNEMRGTLGFGYDPVFFFPPEGKTFAEMPPSEKNRISHRGLALLKLRAWLENAR